MKEMMNALLMYGPNDIRYEKIEKPECPTDGFLIKVKAVGLCGSDIRNLTTDSKKGNYPFVYGHEEVGEIVEIGAECTGFEIGDRIFSPRPVPCMECEACIDGRSEQCQNIKEPEIGGFAEYAAVSGRVLKAKMWAKIPKDIKYEYATLGEPLSSVYSCQRKLNIKFGDTVVIIGAGPIGCFHVRLAKLRGAKTVISIDIAQNRLNTTKELGADYIINSLEIDPIAEVKRITNKKGADHVISATPVVKTQQQTLEMARNGGVITFFGGVPKGTLTPLDTNIIHYNNLWIYGHFGANVKDQQEAFRLAISEEFTPEKFITKVMPMKDIDEALNIAKAGEAIKIVLVP
ncbi:zinc-binding dehydrogenase [Anaerofustis stercorihominis]|uniref:zinc-binding dehydrogenase n=1 Tax=Anaerofustis stercorihominis TaxID=214853 RepID=UPI0039841EE9